MRSQWGSVTTPKSASHRRRRGRLVWFEPKVSVDSKAITKMPMRTGSHALVQNLRASNPDPPRLLFDMIVGGLAGDDDVVDVAFAESSAGDADEAGLLLQFCDGATADVAHAGAESADELEDHGLERPAIGYAAFNALGDKLGEAVLAGALALHDTFSVYFSIGEVGRALEVA